MLKDSEPKVWLRNYATNHSLSEHQVLEIYNAFKNFKCDEYELAENYKVSVSTIYNIIRGRSWRWLNLKPLYRKEM